ncbi:MAG: zinc ribbon domain-containing protein [Candidatus Cloacimonetes bacterium]|jgi:hypothetical protein|nr:zinc ribbon domain-containing protein [Candidatus Cloacimonadota bacterium]
MIIFGWGRQTIKNIGPIFKNHCSHCNNEEHWTITKYTTWFTLFFIPIIPYSIKYFLSCPVCQYGTTLDSNQLEQIKPIAEANQLLIDGKITEIEYKTKVEQLDSGASSAEGEVIEERSLSNTEETNKFCFGCGTKTTEGTKFCCNCGVKIVN